jgi:hypothetical protein
MQRDLQAQREALATVRRFNATLSAKGRVWFWPTIAAALVSRHHWLVIACDSCETMVDLGVLNPVILMNPFVWRCATCNARAATGMAGHASLRWRSIRLFDHNNGRNCR